MTRSEIAKGELCIGKVLKTHGLRGALTIGPLGGDTLLEIDRVILVSPRGESMACEISKRARLSNGNFLISFHEITGKDEAEHYRGWNVMINRVSLEPLA
ncbi:hypothetical protein KKF84_04270, partial [Myxococcota bacterium]|nr:hypothetical protein [Myxococcota bacterium]